MSKQAPPFRVGDKVACIGGVYQSARRGMIFTVTHVRANYIQPELTVLTLDGKLTDDAEIFILANLTDLEKVIYGV